MQTVSPKLKAFIDYSFPENREAEHNWAREIAMSENARRFKLRDLSGNLYAKMYRRFHGPVTNQVIGEVER